MICFPEILEDRKGNFRNIYLSNILPKKKYGTSKKWMTRPELVSIARKSKLPLGMIEKDFVITLVLKEIYGSHFTNVLVFKGGTALHKLYLHRRLSVDIDFTALGEIAAEKMRALVQRKRPRDYFDMWLLLDKIDFKDFEKLAEKKLIAVKDNFDINRVFTDLGNVRSLWKNDLIQLIPELPDFDVVILELKRKTGF